MDENLILEHLIAIFQHNTQLQAQTNAVDFFFNIFSYLSGHTTHCYEEHFVRVVAYVAFTIIVHTCMLV